jgi:transposase
MAKTRRGYSKEFKEEAVRLVQRTGDSCNKVAKDLGIPATCLTRWKRQMEEARPTERVFPGNGNARDEEVARLKKENARLRMERDILKKATGIFSRGL